MHSHIFALPIDLHPPLDRSSSPGCRGDCESGSEWGCARAVMARLCSVALQLLRSVDKVSDDVRIATEYRWALLCVF